jgi:hypothetical protein
LFYSLLAVDVALLNVRVQFVPGMGLQELINQSIVERIIKSQSSFFNYYLLPQLSYITWRDLVA